MSANSIYALLNFPFSDPVMNAAVQPFSANVQFQMNLMPSLVNTWQQDDIATANTGGYFQNPVGTSIQNIRNNANNIVSITNNFMGGNTPNITALVTSTISLANNITTNTANQFLYHTNRMSNVIDITENVELPHYQTAIGYGKMITYITNKTDGVQNNSVLIGSFGSILAANSFNANANVYLYWSNLLSNSIYTDMGGNTYTNLSEANAQNVFAAFSSINNEMWNRRQQDIDFFTNTKTVMERYNDVNQFNNIGQTETDLIMNYIGTDKIKSRLTS
jgi:hypothetical protein